jgi:hypothetical protein
LRSQSTPSAHGTRVWRELCHYEADKGLSERASCGRLHGHLKRGAELPVSYADCADESQANEYSPLHTCAQIRYSNEGMHRLPELRRYTLFLSTPSLAYASVSFNCSCAGDSEGSHLRRACTKKPWKVIHFEVAAFLNECGNTAHSGPPQACYQFAREIRV